MTALQDKVYACGKSRNEVSDAIVVCFDNGS